MTEQVSIKYRRSFVSRHPILTFILITSLISYILNPVIVELINVFFPDFGFSFPLGGLNNRSLVAQYGGTVAAIFVVIKLYGIKGFKSTLLYSKPKLRDVKWLLISFMLPIVIIFLSYLLAGYSFDRLTFIWKDNWLLFLMVIGGHIIASGLAEEYGWRGFVLPQLLKSQSPIMATFILYLMVALWHLPALLTGWKEESIIPFFIIVLPITVIHCWLFFKSNGSLLAPILFHAVFDAQYSFFSNFINDNSLANQPFHRGWSYIILYCIIGFIIILATKGKLGFSASNFSPEGYFGELKKTRTHNNAYS